MCDYNIYSRDLKTPINVDTSQLHEFDYHGKDGVQNLMGGVRMPKNIEYNHAAWKKIEGEHGFKKGIMFIMGEKEDGVR